MNSLIEKINEASNIVILTHEKPDGDAIGSSLTMYYFLKDMNKTVDIVIPDMPHIFNFLDSSLVKDDTEDSYDLGIIVDTSNIERIGQKSNIFSRCKITYCIDHHISNTKYANYNEVDPTAASCSLLLYEILKDYEKNITIDMANAIATGIITDTGGFKNSNVDRRVFNTISELMNMGIDYGYLYYNLITKKTIPQFELLKLVMSRIELFYNNKVAFSYITKEDMDLLKAKEGDHEGLVDIGKSIEGVEVSIFLRQDDYCRISLRSKNYVDVNEIASSFGGGGHINAAGCKLNMSVDEAKKAILKLVRKYIDE